MRWLTLLLSTSISCWAAVCTPVSGYSRCWPLTINHLKVPSTQTNYPAGFAGVCNGAGGTGACGTGNLDLRTTGNGGPVTSSSGFDIVFTSDSAGLTTIACDQEAYATNGTIAYWVLVASASSSVDTTIYVSVGNSGISSAQCASTAVFSTDGSYIGVWHFQLTSAGSNYNASGAPDRSGNADNLTTSSTALVGGAGQTGGRITYDTAHNIVGSASTFPTTGTRTLEIWYNNNGTLGSQQALGGWGSNGTSGAGWIIQVSATQVIPFIGGSSFGTITLSSGSTWHYIVFVLPTGQTTMAGTLTYIDNVLQSPTFTNGSTTVNTQQAALCFGDNPGSCVGGNIPYAGLEDEIRISSNGRSANYVTTVWNNLSAESTFWTVATIVNTQMPPVIL